MAKIALGLAYDGTAYHGFQVQKERATIQSALNNALSLIADHPIHTVCAGRTDAGVHATGQVVHFDSMAERDLSAWTRGTNSHLPSDIRVLWAKTVDTGFHARFSATARRYRYVIYNADVGPAILRHAVSFFPHLLDVDKMQAGANFLLGEHDFSSFRGAGCQSHSRRRHISLLSVKRSGIMVIVEIVGNAFLQHMVRNIVGVLVNIGRGHRPPIWAKTVLEARDRTKACATMFPSGLYLVEVQYPAFFALPTAPIGPFFLT